MRGKYDIIYTMKSLLSVACAAATLTSPLSSFAAWYDSPAVSATVNVGAATTDPHYINVSEDGKYLLVDLHASNPALPVQLYSVADLVAANGAVNKLAMSSALAGDFFGTGTGTGSWKGGAVSTKLGVMMPGSGKSSGALYTAFSVPAFGWKTNETAFALSGFGDAGFDGIDFNAAGTRLYVNQYANGNRNKILAYDTAPLKTAQTLSLLTTKTVDGVTRIRNLSCYTVKGKDLIYFGEGAVSGSNNSVYVYDPAEDSVTAILTDAALFDGDIMNVKLSDVASGCPTMYVQTDNGRLHVFLLSPDGKSVTSAKPVKSFTAAQCATLCGLPAAPSSPKFRSFEVTDDGSAAFFIHTNGPGLCVVKSAPTEDAYISTSPEYTAKHTGNVLFSDYFFGANSRIEVDYAYLDESCYGFIFSPWEANSGSRSAIWRNNGTYTYFVGNRNAGIASVKLADTARHTMCIDAANMKGFIATGDVTNEVNFDEYNITFSTSPWPVMFLGAANGSKTAVNTEHYARAKIYSAKIYESGVLVRDYVPAIVNGVPCLYDRVNGSVAAETRDGMNLPGFGGSVLRLTGETCIQLTSVSGDNSQKGINTGYCMKPTSRIELDCRLDANTPGDTRPIGAWNHAAAPKNLVYVNSGVLTFFLGYLGTWNNRSVTPVKPGTERTTFVLDTPNMTSYVVKDGFIHYSIAAKDPKPTEDATEALALFADSNSPDGTSFQSPALGMKAYSLAIRESGTTVTNFLPFIDISGACMKDVLTGEIIHPRKSAYFFYRLETASDATPGYIVKTTGERNVGFLTDWQFDAQSRVEEDFAFGSTADAQRPFGAWNNTSSKLRTLVWTTSGKLQYFINSGSAAFLTSTATDVDWHKYVIDFTTDGAPTGYYYTGDTLTASGQGTVLANTTDRSNLVSIFADNNGTAMTQTPYAGARFRGMKAYEAGEVVHDWVPSRKDGAVGIADKLTGLFMAADANFGGAGDLWECASDAYVESDGTQVLNTGYKAKKSSRIEVDFMPLDAQSKCYFGVYGSGANSYTYWCAPPYVRFMMMNGNVSSPYQFNCRSIRHTGVIDFKNKEEYVKLGGRKIDAFTADMSSKSVADDWMCPYPMGVCGSMKTEDTISTGPGPAAMRVYAVRIYENDALVHLFVPYSGADGVGLVDMLTGAKAFKHAASVSDPVYVAGPLAVTAAELANVRTTGPGDITIGKGDVAAAIASAAGATAYRWTRNGVVIGETYDGRLGLGWRKQSAADVFTVTPVYRTASGDVDGETASFTVTCPALGSMLIIR